MKEILSHFFIPKESNNHRAKILHHTNIFLLIVFILFSSFLIQNIRQSFPSVLGISTNITTDSLFLLTNTKRTENGVSSLKLDPQLSKAASKKADDMFELDYWAHNSPDGKTPWVFIKNSGYNYVYAGENLARGFSDAKDAINAWMASPTHRANMLSSNYQDVGFAVKIGKLNGEETVLIVEEFGNKFIPQVETASVKAKAIVENPISQKTNLTLPNKPFINSQTLSLATNRIILSLLIFVLSIDMIIVERKKIVRFVGHNIDHIFYLVLIFLLMGILGKGVLI